jgi:hypothetical protein
MVMGYDRGISSKYGMEGLKENGKGRGERK